MKRDAAFNAILSSKGRSAARIVSTRFASALDEYIAAPKIAPLLMQGEATEILRRLPPASFDCCMTSPPYWGKREYENGGFGLEGSSTEFISNILITCGEIKRVLKRGGSFWLNIGDTYREKGLLGIPWRIALSLMDEQGWILRNSVIWNKLKGGMDNTKDRLANTHEHLFHFVKDARCYYYDADAIRSAPRKAKVVNGAVISATGVSGVRYRRQIELSTSLSQREKDAANAALTLMLQQVQLGEISDFRMIIRGQQRATHSSSSLVSGRAKELNEKGFYFLKYHPKGTKPSDVWTIIPEDTQHRRLHFAPYPVDLCRIPILSTCPPDGIVLDPFCGTATTMFAAMLYGRKSVGIDLSPEYLRAAKDRCSTLL